MRHAMDINAVTVLFQRLMTIAIHGPLALISSKVTCRICGTPSHCCTQDSRSEAQMATDLLKKQQRPVYELGKRL